MSSLKIPEYKSARNLDELRVMLVADHAAHEKNFPDAVYPDDWSNLPLFGREDDDPREADARDYGECVWSWSDDEVLCGRSADELVVVERVRP